MNYWPSISEEITQQIANAFVLNRSEENGALRVDAASVVGVQVLEKAQKVAEMKYGKCRAWFEESHKGANQLRIGP